MLQGGLGPFGRMLVYPHLPGDLVGCDEAHSVPAHHGEVIREYTRLS